MVENQCNLMLTGWQMLERGAKTYTYKRDIMKSDIFGMCVESMIHINHS